MKKIKQHPALVFADDINKICEPIKQLDLVYFSHARVQDNKFSVLAMQPNYLKLYLENQYYHFDAHKLETEQSERLILWDTLKRKAETKQLHDDFMVFDQAHTFTIMRQYNGVKDCFHFAAKKGNTCIYDKNLANLERLKKFILYFQDRVSKHKELNSAYDVTFKLPEQKGGYLVEDASVLAGHDDYAIDRYYLSADVYITKRELMVLEQLSLGKTLEQSATCLDITLRTIKSHVENIKNRTGCENHFQMGLLYARCVSSTEPKR